MPILVLSECSKSAIEVISWSNEEGTSFINLKSIGELKRDDAIFDCYCSGILCYKVLWSSPRAILLNPLKEEVMFLRESPLQSASLDTVLSSYGLGFGIDNGQYKIVSLILVKNKRDGKWHFDNLAEVMSLGSPNWRAIQHVPNIQFLEQPVFENGCIYWLSKKSAPQKLLVFNVKHEVFSVVEFPIEVDKIIDLGGRLGLVVGEGLEVWFSTSHDDDGKINNWGKYDEICIFGDEGKRIKSCDLELLGVWNDGNILIRLLDHIVPKKFVSYDLISKRTTMVDDPKEDGHAYKTYQAHLFSLSEFCGSSKLPDLPPGKTYNPR